MRAPINERDQLDRVMLLYLERAARNPTLTTEEARLQYRLGIALGYARWALEQPAQLRAHLSVVSRSGRLPDADPT